MEIALPTRKTRTAERNTAMGFEKAYRATPIERVAMVKLGVPAGMVVDLATRMGISKEQLLRTLGLARATIDRKVREGSRLGPDESSRVLGLRRLIGRAQVLVDDAGSAKDFDAAAWAAQWLEQPMPALGGQRPATLMDTSEGQAIVLHLLEQIGSGAYA